MSEGLPESEGCRSKVQASRTQGSGDPKEGHRVGGEGEDLMLNAAGRLAREKGRRTVGRHRGNFKNQSLTRQVLSSGASLHRWPENFTPVRPARLVPFVRGSKFPSHTFVYTGKGHLEGWRCTCRFEVMVREHVALTRGRGESMSDRPPLS